MSMAQLVSSTEHGLAFGPSNLVEAADYALRKFASFGVSLPPRGRLERAKGILSRYCGSTCIAVSSDDDRGLIAQASITCFQQYVIARALSLRADVLTSVKLHDCIIEMQSGRDSAVQDRNHRARNTQFELFVLALLTAGK